MSIMKLEPSRPPPNDLSLRILSRPVFFTLPTQKERFWPKGGTALQRVLLTSSTEWIPSTIDLVRYVNAESWKFRICHTWSNDATPVLLIWLLCDPLKTVECASLWNPPPVFHLRTRPTFHELWMKDRGLGESLRLYAPKVAAYNGSLSPTIVERIWEEIQKVVVVRTE